MSRRFTETTKWLCLLFVLYSGPSSSPVLCVTIKSPPKNPPTIESQAKFFQDFFSVQLSPHNIEFGHVCEDPNSWEQRYEKKDYKNHRDMGKVRWGDKKGGYGEHYWDLNHAGHADNHGGDSYDGHSDDGSYNNHDTPTNYEGPSDHSYTSDDYDPEKSSYEESGRAKRAYPRIKSERKRKPQIDDDEEEVRPKPRKVKEQPQEAQSHSHERYSDEDDESEEVYTKPKPKRNKIKYRQTYYDDEEEEDEPPKEQKKQVVLVVKEKEPQEPKPFVTEKPAEYTKYVPYDGGAGVRQHQHPEVTAAASVPRLFLEPSTGHVIDRATGQAYVLQPVPAAEYN